MLKFHRLFVTIFLLSLLNCTHLNAQYAPPAEQPGSTAIHADSSVFVAWATSAILERGLVQINKPDLGFATFGNQEDALGAPDINVVSLGDVGQITLGFVNPIQNGHGADFAVFENSFSDTFLELAHVEVSSDGVNFVRFPSVSLTPAEVQVAGFGNLETTLIHNLAGKYRAYFGTPFDLNDIVSDLINLDSVTYIRIIDVVGTIDQMYGTYDAAGRLINDPWPTPFPSSGFDLDAVGVIHQAGNTGINEVAKQSFQVFPNPFVNRITFLTKSYESQQQILICDLLGNVVHSELLLSGQSYLDLGFLPKGLYQFIWKTNNNLQSAKLLKQ